MQKERSWGLSNEGLCGEEGRDAETDEEGKWVRPGEEEETRCHGAAEVAK